MRFHGRIAVDAHFRAQGFVPSVRLELGSNEAVKESVAGGLGLAVLSVHALGGAAADMAAQLPALDIDVQNFELNGRALGWTLVAAAFTAGYVVCDGQGVRRAGTAWSYGAGMSVLNALAWGLWLAFTQRGRPGAPCRRCPGGTGSQRRRPAGHRPPAGGAV